MPAFAGTKQRGWGDDTMIEMKRVFLAGALLGVLVGCGSVVPGASNGDAGTEASPAAAEINSCAANAACGEITCKPYGDENDANRCMKTGCSTPVDVCGTVQFLASGSTSSSTSGSSGAGPAVYGKNGPNTEKDAACALAALRDAVPGTRVKIDLSTIMGGTFLTLEVAADRRAAGSESVSYDSPLSLTGLRGRTLKPASYFAACLENPDLNAQAYCLKDSLLACN